jgi:CheY-like chemotaxis protein
MKALVVHSSSTMRSVLRRILSMRGFEVAEADNGQQALEVFHSMGTVDLVLMDWILHDMDGLDFIARIRDKTATNTIVIVLVAAKPGMRELQRALIAGADHYLTQPITSLQIDEKLTQAGLAW